MKKSTKLFFATVLVLLCISAELFGQVPVANFTISPTLRCTNSVLQITDLSTNSPTAWSYTMTGGTPAASSVQNPTVTYATTGVKTIVLIATNGAGPSAPVTRTINVLGSPNFGVSPPSQTMCAGGGPLIFTATAFSFPPPTFSWSTGATTNTISVSPSVTTVYTAVATSTNGCTASRTGTAIVNPLPTVTITANPVSICSGGTSTLTATATGPGPWTYTWSTAATTSFITTNIAGVYSATVANANGCRGIRSYTLTSGITPTVTTVSSTSVLCSGQSATLTSSGATTYTYNPGSITGNPIAVSPTVSTTYTVTGASAAGCTNTTVRTISVNAPPTVNATSSSTLICTGQTATLVAAGATTYTWMPGNIVGNFVAVSPTVTTTYTVTGTASNNCSNTGVTTLSVSACTEVQLLASVTSTVIVFPSPNNGEFTVTVSAISENMYLEIYNILGQLVNKSLIKDVKSSNLKAFNSLFQEFSSLTTAFSCLSHKPSFSHMSKSIICSVLTSSNTSKTNFSFIVFSISITGNESFSGTSETIFIDGMLV